MKILIGILVGLLTFGAATALVKQAFKKFPEAIAQEKCERVRKTASILIPDRVPITI